MEPSKSDWRLYRNLPRVARGQLCPHIHNLDAGQRVAAVALGEPDELGAAILGGVKALGAGGSAGQKEQGAVLRRPLPGHLVGWLIYLSISSAVSPIP